MWIDATSDSDHPKELVDIITRIVGVTTEDNKSVVNVKSFSDFISVFLRAGHGETDSSDVGVVPGVVVDEDGSVTHTSDLVAVIPPGHDLSVRSGVSSEPVVSLSVVVDDVSVSLSVSAGENDGW